LISAIKSNIKFPDIHLVGQYPCQATPWRGPTITSYMCRVMPWHDPYKTEKLFNGTEETHFTGQNLLIFAAHYQIR